MNDPVEKFIYRPFQEGGRVLKNPAQDREMVIRRMYRRVISEMCMNRFNWQGLPDTVDLRYLEQTLLLDGLCVFYFDQEFGRYMALRATGMGERIIPARAGATLRLPRTSALPCCSGDPLNR